MKELETIRMDKEDGVTTITLNRPEKRNAMNPQMHFDLCEALEELTSQADTRVLVLTGAGPSFCAGQDLKQQFLETAEDPVARMRSKTASHRWRMELLRPFPAPTIAMVNGYCFGGGIGIVAACDLAVAADEAVFGLSEINWGSFPGGTLPKALPDLVPFRELMYYTLTGETFGGRRAVEIHFVNFSVPLTKLREFTWELAEKLKKNDPDALRVAKEVMKVGKDMTYDAVAQWTEAKNKELRLSTKHRWKKAVEQFVSEKKYRPGLGSYDWEQEKK